MYHLKNNYLRVQLYMYSEKLSVTVSYDLNVPKQFISIPIRLAPFSYNSNMFNDDICFS